MCDLEDWPHHLVLLATLERGILRIFHLVAKLEQCVFDIFEAIWWGLATL